jgi:hypothetical protein
MDVSRYPAPLPAAAAILLLVATAVPAMAGADEASCELKISGHSIVRLTLVEKTQQTGVRFDRPGDSIQLPAGEYRVEGVELEQDYVLASRPSQRRDWFEVTPAGPNELVVGAPLYPTASARRHGGFLQLDYSTVDGAGRSYSETSDGSTERPRPPMFAVYQNGAEIGSGSFEYG